MSLRNLSPQAMFRSLAAEHTPTCKFAADSPDACSSWQAETLPQQGERQQGGRTLVLYPALVSTDRGVVRRELPRADEARAAHAEGVQALLMRQLHDKVDYLRKKLPLKAACLRYAPHGSCEALKQAIIERALRQRIGDPAAIRTKQAWQTALADLRAHLIADAQTLADYVDSVLLHHQQLQGRLRQASPRWRVALEDIRQQLEGLIFTDFVRLVPAPWFHRLDIYLRGIEKRLERVENNPGKDQQAQAELAPLLQAWQALTEQLGTEDEQVVEIRWLLEELRLQLFSPPLKPAQPVSVKRLQKKMEQARKGG